MVVEEMINSMKCRLNRGKMKIFPKKSRINYAVKKICLIFAAKNGNNSNDIMSKIFYTSTLII